MKKEFIRINTKVIYNDYIIEKTVILVHNGYFYTIKKNKKYLDILYLSQMSYKSKPSYKWIKIL